jgi:hypothetical protein
MGSFAMKIVAIVSSAVLLLSIAGSALPQQGAAVSVERCRSDLASWTRDFSYVDMAREDQLLTFDELTRRIDEAKGCRVLDVREPYYTAAATVQASYGAMVKDRLYDFVNRHNLGDQFRREDASGLR